MEWGEAVTTSPIIVSTPSHTSGPLGMSDIVAAVVAAVEFLDLRTFERAFPRQYGMTSGGCRREPCHSGSAP
jgi:hypothetical protein